MYNKKRFQKLFSVIFTNHFSCDILVTKDKETKKPFTCCGSFVAAATVFDEKTMYPTLRQKQEEFGLRTL